MAVASSRRGFCKGGAALALGLVSAAAAGPSPRTSRGTIFDIQTWKGIPNVRISNGRDVVMSNQYGEYEISLQPNDIPFIIKPRDYRPALDENFLPLISKGARLRADFFLEPCDESAQTRVLLIADPQPGDEVELAYLSRCIERIQSTARCDVAIVLGDLIGDNFDLYAKYDRIMSRLGIPVWNVPGNHDMDLSCKTPMGAKKMWRERYGPSSRAFEIGDSSFILLDNIGLRMNSHGELTYFGSVGEDNLEFVRSYLQTLPMEQSILLFTHIPLTSSINIDRDDCHTHDAFDLLALFSGRNCISFSGHMHAFEQHMMANGGEPHNHRILNALSGSWWSGPFAGDGLPISQSCDGTPIGWYILEIDKGETELKFVQARSGDPYRINLIHAQDGERRLCENVIESGRANSACFQINIFEGGPHTQVEAFLDEDVRLHAIHVFDFDVQTSDLFAQAGETLKSWVRPIASTHIWRIDMPADLECGTHCLVGSIKLPDQRVFDFRYEFKISAS